MEIYELVWMYASHSWQEYLYVYNEFFGVNYIALHNPEGFPYQTRNPLTSNHVMIWPNKKYGDDLRLQHIQ